jgi:hypothetical protein
MRKEDDNIERLFSSRLAGVEMDVRDDLWESLNNDVIVARGHRRLIFYRIASCAAVLALLLTTSAAIWWLSPKEDMKDTFTRIDKEVIEPIPFGDFALNSKESTSVKEKPRNNNLSTNKFSNVTYDEDNDSLLFSFTFTISATSNDESDATRNNLADNLWRTGLSNSTTAQQKRKDEAIQADEDASHKCIPKWSSKLFVGSALPDGYAFKAPINVGISVERRFNKLIGVEAGATYTMLRSSNNKQHVIGIPVKINAHIAETKKTDIYTTVGGVVEKCIASATGSFDKQVYAGVTAGAGVCYKLKDKLALFAEPTVTHHLISKRDENIQSKRRTNMSLIAGVRITY